VQLVALVTDDPANQQARIGLKKRVWKFLDREEQVGIETAIVTSALSAGIPVYTGEVKIDGFRRLLTGWRPDAIISCVFGQVLDTFIIEQPAYGIYNFHPSDLKHGHGAGVAPYDDLVARGATKTVWTIHQVTETVDGGPIVGHSPWIEVGDAQGLLPANPLLVYDKLLEPVGWLMCRLVTALSQRYAEAVGSPIERLDLQAAMPETLRARLRQPVMSDRHVRTVPSIDPAMLSSC
jgi:hypothetical protein